MGDHRSPKWIVLGELENAGKCEPGRKVKVKEWADGVAQDRRVFENRRDWSTAALHPSVSYSTVCEGGCRFMTAWMRKEKKESETRQKKKGGIYGQGSGCTWGDRIKLETF